VLFRTNTFHMSGLDLQLNLSQLLLPQRLSRVTSLEMLWNLTSPSKHWRSGNLLYGLYTDPSMENSPLHQLCRMIPLAFPNIRYLYISLECFIGPQNPNQFPDTILATEEIVLGPIEDMIRTLGPGRECSIAIQGGAWTVLLKKYRYMYESALRVEMENCIRGRFWKALDPSLDGLGYWICSGWDDIAFLGRDYWTFDLWGLNRTPRPRWAADYY